MWYRTRNIISVAHVKVERPRDATTLQVSRDAAASESLSVACGDSQKVNTSIESSIRESIIERHEIPIATNTRPYRQQSYRIAISSFAGRQIHTGAFFSTRFCAWRDSTSRPSHLLLRRRVAWPTGLEQEVQLARVLKSVSITIHLSTNTLSNAHAIGVASKTKTTC